MNADADAIREKVIRQLMKEKKLTRAEASIKVAEALKLMEKK